MRCGLFCAGAALGGVIAVLGASQLLLLRPKAHEPSSSSDSDESYGSYDPEDPSDSDNNSRFAAIFHDRRRARASLGVGI